LTALAVPGPAAAQLATQLEPDPNQPVKEGFDTHRASFFETSNFTPLRDPEWRTVSAGPAHAGVHPLVRILTDAPRH